MTTCPPAEYLRSLNSRNTAVSYYRLACIADYLEKLEEVIELFERGNTVPLHIEREIRLARELLNRGT
jgi:hypothetical protein